MKRLLKRRSQAVLLTNFEHEDQNGIMNPILFLIVFNSHLYSEAVVMIVHA